MRIIAGEAGSLKLLVPPSITRPTTDRVREAVFSSLGNRLIEADVVDLFAGSGSLGLESLSRGARSAVFVDNNSASEKTIEANLMSSRLKGGKFIRRDALSYLSSVPEAHFDIIFADPPYARDEETTALLSAILDHEKLVKALKPDGLLVLETFAKAPVPDNPLWSSLKEKVYGKTRVSYLSPNS
ncbi:MAG: 16S rRNA (guanine(966)-N(2))-methyltransferase RsmD [Verrucomicrobiales bacterium]|nr:16S rRNA (guanine(966)-N(2))-methyltransferase RsmD [Verrucomicrobiales bacterium]